MKKLTMHDLAEVPVNMWHNLYIETPDSLTYASPFTIKPRIVVSKVRKTASQSGNVKTKSDARFLNAYLENFHIHYAKEHVALKDTMNRYIASTPEYARLMGFDTEQQLIDIGYSRKDLHYNECIDLFHQQDLLTAQLKQNILCMDNFECAEGNLHSIICHKKPLINPDTNNVLGIRLKAEKPLILSPLKLFFSLNTQQSTPFNLGGDFRKCKIKLSKRQHLVLYLTIHRYTQGDISNFFTLLNDKMSVKTVATTLHRLKERFNVSSNEELIYKSNQLGLHTQVPKMLFKKGSFILNNHQIEIKQ